MSNVKKLMMSAAGGEGLSIEELFSAYTYDGNGTTKTITNNIDLSGEGGMVWTKNRTLGVNHNLTYTDDASDRLFPNLSNAADTGGSSWSYASDGYSVTGNNTQYNYSGSSFASWTFRKAPKFFDVQTWTGNGTSGRTISHNLGSDPGMVIVKRTDSSQNWVVHHRSLTATKYLALNLTSSEINGSDITATSSTNITLSNSFNVNGSSATYVGFFFAHNNSDGEFGPTGDQDIIKCGSYTGTGGDDNKITVGFEPQWIMLKNMDDGATDWVILDATRGMNDTTSYVLRSNTSYQEYSGGDNYAIDLHPDGFSVNGLNTNTNYTTSNDFIYVAIRRGPMKTPANATDVFDVQRGASPFTSDFPVDLGIQKNVTSTGNWFWYNRLRGDNRFTMSNSTNADATSSSQEFDKMDQWGGSNWGSQSAGYSFRRAPGFFDMTIIPGNGSTTNTTYYHSLGVVPELIIGKQVSTGNAWWVYHKDVYPNDHTLNSDGYGGVANVWNDSSSYVPTATTFTTRGQGFNEAASNRYVIYLWATLAGISKVGTYTGNGSSSGDSQNIDCGFSNGARFVMIKRINHIYSDWYVADTGRGINAGNDSYMYMNRDNAEYTSVDWIDPYSSGFTVVYTNIYGQNISGDTYMYLAIA